MNGIKIILKNKMNNNVLLTGTTGFVGRNLLKSLAGSGCNVRCIVRNRKKLGLIRDLNAEFAFGDITKKKSISNSMRGIDVVFHLAVMVSVSECLKNPAKAFETNTLGTLNLLEEARREAIRSNKEIFFVYLSSDRVYGKCKAEIISEEACPEPLEPYAVSKLNSEMLIKCYSLCYNNLSYAILRSANVYGYGQSTNFFIPSIINQVLKGKNEIKIGNTGYYRNFVYINDLIDALALVMEKKDKCKNKLFNVSESSIKMSHVTSSIMELTARYLNKSLKFSKSEILARSSALELNKCILDCSKIAKIGWKPKVKFDDGLKKTFEEFLNKDG